MEILLIVLVLLSALYVLALRGRTGHPELEGLRGWNYAHRGLHNEERPENSMAAFRAALEHGYGIELDVHLLKDGNLAVIHDSSLKRTAGADVNIEELTTADLEHYRLGGTEECIPEFRQLLELYAGKAPLIVELKPAGGNHAALTEAACRMLDSYNGPYCLESFDPRCILWLKQNRPDLIRGQLAYDYIRYGAGKVSSLLRFVLTHQLENFVTLPDFVAYRYCDRKKLGNFIVRKLWGVQGVTWTLKNLQEHETAVAEGWIPIFEDYEP